MRPSHPAPRTAAIMPGHAARGAPTNDAPAAGERRNSVIRSSFPGLRTCKHIFQVGCLSKLAAHACSASRGEYTGMYQACVPADPKAGLYLDATCLATMRDSRDHWR